MQKIPYYKRAAKYADLKKYCEENCSEQCHERNNHTRELELMTLTLNTKIYEKVDPGRTLVVMEENRDRYKVANGMNLIKGQTNENCISNIYHPEVIKVQGPVNMSSFTVICDWNQRVLGDSSETILRMKEHNINRAGMAMIYELQNNPLELEYFWINNVKLLNYLQMARKAKVSNLPTSQ